MWNQKITEIIMKKTKKNKKTEMLRIKVWL